MMEARFRDEISDRLGRMVLNARSSLGVFLENRHGEVVPEILPLLVCSEKLLLPYVTAATSLATGTMETVALTCVSIAILSELSVRLPATHLSDEVFQTLRIDSCEIGRYVSTLELLMISKAAWGSGKKMTEKLIESILRFKSVSGREEKLFSRRKIDFLSTFSFVEKTLGTFFGEVASLPAMASEMSTRTLLTTAECGRLFLMLYRLRMDSFEAMRGDGFIRPANLFVSMLVSRASGYETAFLRKTLLSGNRMSLSQKERSLVKLLVKKYRIEEEILEVMENCRNRLMHAAENLPEPCSAEIFESLSRNLIVDIRDRKINRMDIFADNAELRRM